MKKLLQALKDIALTAVDIVADFADEGHRAEDPVTKTIAYTVAGVVAVVSLAIVPVVLAVLPAVLAIALIGYIAGLAAREFKKLDSKQ